MNDKEKLEAISEIVNEYLTSWNQTAAFAKFERLKEILES